MKKYCLQIGIMGFLLFMTGMKAGFAQSNKDIERTGDVLQVAIPLTAYGMTYLFDDPVGRRNLATSFFSTLGSTYALKYSFPDERPDGGELSFVSAHTSAAFSGAAFIQRRYGWKYGIPAYLGAAFVGWSRVKSEKHYPDDVLRGAALGIFTAYIFTRPYNSNIRVSPVVGEHTVGLALHYSW